MAEQMYYANRHLALCAGQEDLMPVYGKDE
jgi:hypothetical protein